MRVTIIPSDNQVYIDSVCKFNLDLTQCSIPPDVHALQWFDTKGWIEFKSPEDPFEAKRENEIIAELPSWASACVGVWEGS